VAAGLLRPEGAYAALGEIVARHSPGRTTPETTIIFASTGIALQDGAAAVAGYQRARRADVGQVVALRE
jgi:ornithine cyclodeaminase/alanine dehydrogenase-like protein (mu-crystallin family)